MMIQLGFGGYSDFVKSTGPFFSRGGYCKQNYEIFSSNSGYVGNASEYYGFRTTLCI